MWEAANDKQEGAIENATVRFAVRVGAEGDGIRLRLSNEYGEPLTIGAVSVGRPGEKTVPVRFGGRPSTRVPAGATLISDAAELPVDAFDVIDVSVYRPGAVELNTIHGASVDKTSI